MMAAHSLTIACATYRDDEGVWFTFTQLLHAIEELRNSQPQTVAEWNFQFLVADNDPQAMENSQWLRRFCQAYNISYLPANQVVGTAFPRDQAIRQARSDYVLVLDSHVYVTGSAIASLLDYLRKNWGTDDLIQGPLIYDWQGVGYNPSRLAYDDCYVPMWRDEMLGISSRVWLCSCGNFFFCPFPDPVLVDAHSRLKFWDATVSDPHQQGRAGEVTACPICGRTFPDGQRFVGHERLLAQDGFTLAIATDLEAYPIPMLGLGLFCVRRESWLGFAQGMSGFGGEEGLIHGMYRSAGREVVCIRGLQWRHYFGQRPIRAPVKKFDKARNFVLMAQHAGRRTVDDIYEHFVKGTNNSVKGRLTDNEWETIMAEARKHCGRCPTQSLSASSADPPPSEQSRKFQMHLPSDMPSELAEWLRQFTNKLQPQLADELAQLLWHIATIAEALRGKRAWVAGRFADLIAALVAYSQTKPAHVVLLPGGDNAGVPLATLAPIIARQENLELNSIDSSDVLVLSRYYLYEKLHALLQDVAAKFGRVVVLWADVTYASNEKIVTEFDRALSQFLQSHTEFSRVYYSRTSGGLAILSKLREDKKQPPPIWKLVPRYVAFKLWFWLRSLFSGSGYLSASDAQRRWQICLLCDARFGDRCGECGCYLRQFPNGALGRVWYRDRDCPREKWPKVS